MIGGKFVCPGDTYLIAYNAATGAVAWRRPCEWSLTALGSLIPARIDGAEAVISAGAGANVPGWSKMVLASPLYIDGLLYFVSMGGA